MLPRVIFCTAVSLAILAVILLALLSPVVHRRPSKKDIPWLALSLYIQQPRTPSFTAPQPMARSEGAGAFVFHRTLTEGPENTSRVVGKAQGFIIPIEHFAHSYFNIICLTFDTPEYSGSLSVQAKQMSHKKNREELTVVGGTGSFAFARGRAIFAKAERRSPEELDATYHVKLHLEFPNRSQTIPG